MHSVNLALQQLPQVELHPALRSDGRRWLKDVYYSIDKIEAFKQRCLDKEESLHRKIQDIAARLKDAKQSIKEVKGDRQTKNKELKDSVNQVFNAKVNRIKDEAAAKIDVIYRGRRE